MTHDERRDLVATPSQTVGPFFHAGLTAEPALGTLAAHAPGDERIRLRIRVLDGQGAPVPDAMIEIYQADAHGAYAQAPFTGFGRLPTGEDGTCTFETVRPGPVPGSGQAAHVNICVFARGLLRHLYTRLYFAGDVEIESDPVVQHVPADRRHALLATAAPGHQHTWDFVVRLQGEDETVFFDI